jgi:hypothetical protein
MPPWPILAAFTVHWPYFHRHELADGEKLENMRFCGVLVCDEYTAHMSHFFGIDPPLKAWDSIDK